VAPYGTMVPQVVTTSNCLLYFNSKILNRLVAVSSGHLTLTLRLLNAAFFASLLGVLTPSNYQWC
jgi:hypothetical protein